jgi:hypothetical protein
MRTSKNRKQDYKTDPFTAAYDSTFWSEVTNGDGAVSIASSKLKLNCPTNGDVAGLVSQIPYNLRNARFEFDVDMSNDSTRAGICLAKTQVTTSNPESEDDILYLVLDQANDKCLLKHNWDGGTAKTVYNGNWTDAAATLKLDIEPDGYFLALEDALERVEGSLNLTETTAEEAFQLYIYLYAVGVTGTEGYALFDNFHFHLDTSPTSYSSREGRGASVRSYHTDTIIGRKVDTAGTLDLFETDHAVTDTPTEFILLSKPVRKFELQEVRAYINPTNAVTPELMLFEKAIADDDRSAARLAWRSGAALVDSATYVAIGNKMSTGAATQANAHALPVVLNLDVPGKVWYNIDWSGAPGDTKGSIRLVGREVE